MKSQDSQLDSQQIRNAVDTKERLKLIVKQIEELDEKFRFPHSDKYLKLCEEYKNLINKLGFLPRLPFDPFSADAYEIRIEEELISRTKAAIEGLRQEGKNEIAELAKTKLMFYEPVKQVRLAKKLKAMEPELDKIDSLTILDSILAAAKNKVQLPDKFLVWFENRLSPLRMDGKPSFEAKESFGKLPKATKAEIRLKDGTAYKIFTLLVEAEKTGIKLSKHGEPGGFKDVRTQQTYHYISEQMKTKYGIDCKPGQIKSILDLVEKNPTAKMLYEDVQGMFELMRELDKINF